MNRPQIKRTTMTLALTLAGLWHPLAQAVDLNLGDVAATVHGAVTLGTSLRTESRDPGLLQAGNGGLVGTDGTAAGGRNSDDGDLNFARGERISTALKAVGSIELKQDNLGLMLRAKAWHDFTLGEADAPFGNAPNGYRAGQPLSDKGFSARAKFSGAVFQEAYVSASFKPGAMPLSLRLGDQMIPWGGGWSISGGLSAINAMDLPALRRPGVLPEEVGVPIPALSARLAISADTRVEAFHQFRFRATEIDGCGTYFSTYDYLAQGCNVVFVAGATDVVGTRFGLYGKRAPTPEVSNSGQFGLGLNIKAPSLATDFGVYLAQYHSRLPVASAIKSPRGAGGPFLPGDPDGLNVQYLTEYPEDIRMLGLTFMTKGNNMTLAGELTYRPNQPVALNATDLIRAFASNVAPSALRGDAIATAPGGVFHGYDRRHVLQAQLSASGQIKGLWGAESVSLGGEVGAKYMNDLPDPATRRYGRSDIFDIGPVGGVCAGSAIQCSDDGYVSKMAWGYRLRVGLRYPNVADQLDLMPALSFAHDVRGWSHDNAFNEGRRTLGLALRAAYQKMYLAEISWTPTWGGYYNASRDRSVLSATVGLRF
ncbi:DUF1302 domain-containing protein [Denitratisoma oestradiolicum]|uniref:DUF1302 domain-containing protein n=1 Tax=Denitratisoma oestradiolicum TaxID=311182 RepID=A0A6S6Y4T9_9PROT|nr:DUF1302 domain-containing protein [Denitratisoma oestradiolicum]CAB1367618.1 conserved exported protein of unknown function [Denitratisoma oestradiolicum]